VALYRSLPPLPDTEEGTGLARIFCEDQVPVAEESSSGSDDDQTLGFILKRRKKTNDPSDEDPHRIPALPESHPTKLRIVVRKRKASESSDIRYVLVSVSCL